MAVFLFATISDMRLWALWRRSLYLGALFLVLAFFGVTFYFSQIYKAPTCFDNKRNGNESGIDCGGGCVRICAAEVEPPAIIWANSFRITDGQYNAVAYIQNPNQVAGTEELKYRFELFNGDQRIAERTGVTVLPPNSVYPLFEGRIRTEASLPVTNTRITLEPVDIWQPATIGRDQFKARDIDLKSADERPRLDVEIENTELTDASDIEVVATIFNSKGEPVTASQTFIEDIGGRSFADIVFTWPESIARTVTSCVVPTDVALAIDLSGSMNNDGGDPPQPVTAALEAASSFVSELDTDDQAAVITFASNASVRSQLSNTLFGSANTITSLRIDPGEEAGFTNTLQALILAQGELNSNRHNQDARRVLVVLTDGLPTAPDDVDIIGPTIEQARVINQDGIEVYAIGLGANVDSNFIRQIATDESNAYFAPTGNDLQAIYSEITSALCESGPTKIDVIAKTGANFQPLR